MSSNVSFHNHFLAVMAIILAAVFVTANAHAEIALSPDCAGSVISATVDDDSALSSDAVIQLDGVAVTGDHSLSNANKTISVSHSSACDDIDFNALTIVDGSTTHQ